MKGGLPLPSKVFVKAGRQCHRCKKDYHVVKGRDKFDKCQTCWDATGEGNRACPGCGYYISKIAGIEEHPYLDCCTECAKAAFPPKVSAIPAVGGRHLTCNVCHKVTCVGDKWSYTTCPDCTCKALRRYDVCLCCGNSTSCDPTCSQCWSQEYAHVCYVCKKNVMQVFQAPVDKLHGKTPVIAVVADTSGAIGTQSLQDKETEMNELPNSRTLLSGMRADIDNAIGQACYVRDYLHNSDQIRASIAHLNAAKAKLGSLKPANTGSTDVKVSQKWYLTFFSTLWTILTFAPRFVYNTGRIGVVLIWTLCAALGILAVYPSGRAYVELQLHQMVAEAEKERDAEKARQLKAIEEQKANLEKMIKALDGH